MFYDTNSRSLYKAISWRAVATLITLIVVYVFTGKFFTSLAATLVAAVVSTVAYYFHERAWNRVAWGKENR